jgi:hypothetical protein
MSIKFRIGNLIVITTNDKEDDWETRLEDKIESLEAKAETKVGNWIANDRFFDGFRNTYGRTLITIMSWAGLFGFGYAAFTNAGLFWWYLVTMLILVLMNQLSVRFAFAEDNTWRLDEYHAARRDRAYHGAYRRVGNMVSLLIIIVLGNWAFDFGGEDFVRLMAKLPFELHISWTLEQLGVVLVGITAYFSLLKYLAWGMKGEPWRSKDEPNE